MKRLVKSIASLIQLYRHNRKVIMNPKVFRHRQIPAPARVKVTEIRNHRVAYDCNSMAVTKLSPGQEPPTGTESVPMCESSGVLQVSPYIVLNVTHRCNLACEYCFVQNYEEDLLGHMSFPTAVAAIESFQNIRCAKTPIRTGFFGGEPTLNMPVVRQVVAYVKDDAAKKSAMHNIPPEKMKPQFHMTTNGVLAGLDPNIADFLINEDFSLIVSIDGPEHIHNAARPAKGKVNSYQATRSFLERLKGTPRAKQTTLRATFSAHNINLLERVKHLNELMWSGCAAHVSVEPMSLSEDACVKDSARLIFDDASLEDLQRRYYEVADWIVERIREGRYPRLHHFNTPVKRLFNREPHFSECGAGKGGYYTVEPDGTICACHRTANTKIGHLLTGVDESLRAKWIDNRFYMREGCSDCDMRFLCGGGCRSNSLDHGYSIHRPVWMDCAFKRMWYGCAMWLMCELTQDEIKRFINGPRGEKACG